jgi:hypothetical protein
VTGTLALTTTCTPGAQLAALGGTIENGTYVTDWVTHYDCDSGSSSTNGTTWSICGNRWDAPGTSYSATYQGNTVMLTETCPSAILNPQTFGYTATPGHFAFVENGGIIDHVKQWGGRLPPCAGHRYRVSTGPCLRPLPRCGRRTIRDRARQDEDRWRVACVRPIAGERLLPLQHLMRWVGLDPERGVADLAEADAPWALGPAGRRQRLVPRERFRKPVLDGRRVNACWIDELCVHRGLRLDFARPARCERESENGSLNDRHDRPRLQAGCQGTRRARSRERSQKG